MNTERIQRLERLIKSSLILLPAERGKWLDRLPRMEDEDMDELENVLTDAMSIKWDKVLPAYKKELPKMKKVVENVIQKISSHS